MKSAICVKYYYCVWYIGRPKLRPVLASWTHLLLSRVDWHSVVLMLEWCHDPSGEEAGPELSLALTPMPHSVSGGRVRLLFGWVSWYRWCVLRDVSSSCLTPVFGGSGASGSRWDSRFTTNRILRFWTDSLRWTRTHLSCRYKQ